uniref:Small nuclear RNA activating complex, polypeptide 4 n=1 Tax=Periophthalmus magnuspinnatus TaxID=409849 RepID=A0A3B4AQ23_9GOBI
MSVGGESLEEQRRRLQREVQLLEQSLNTADLTQLSSDSGNGLNMFQSEMELPPSLESCLQMNLVYQQVIQETLEQLERLLQQNDKQEKKEEELIGDRFADVDWDRISNIDFEGSREPGDLQCFWQNFLHPVINKKRWSDEEISKLKELSLKNQERDWTRTSEELGTNRTAFMCLQTYQRFGSKSLRKRTWTREEDAQLRALVDKMRIGNFIPYTQMCYFMEDRLPGQLLYRWSQVLDPKLKRGPWSPEEDQLLLAAIEKYGAKHWWKIRYEVPGRTDCACRDRYYDCLKPDNKKGPFDERENLMLRNLVQKHGYGRWSKIAAEIPNRTDAQCMRAYKKLLTEAGIYRHKETREGSKETGEEMRRREKVTAKDTEKTTKRERNEAEEEPNKLGKETVKEEGEMRRRQSEDSSLALRSQVTAAASQGGHLTRAHFRTVFCVFSLCLCGVCVFSLCLCGVCVFSLCLCGCPLDSLISSIKPKMLHGSTLTLSVVSTCHSPLPPCVHRGRRLTEMSLSYRLQAVMVPWVGHVIVKEPTQELPRPREGLNQGSSKTGPGPNRDLSSSSLFRFFLHVLRVDAEGCKRTIEERRRRAELRSRTVADILKMKQIKQEVTRPSLLGPAPLQTSHAPPQAGHMYLPVLLSHNVAQSQNVRLAPPPGTQSSAPLVTPQNMQVLMHFSPNSLSPQTLFTVAPSVWTQHGQVPTSSSSSPLPPLPTFSSCPLPPLPSSSSSSEAVIVSAAATKGAPPSSETQNVRPAPPSFTQSSSSLLTAPPQNVQGFLTLPPNPTSSLAPPSVFTVMAPGWTQHGRHASSPLQSLSAKTQNVLPNSPNSLQNVRPLPFLSPSKKQNVRPLPFLSPSKRQNKKRLSSEKKHSSKRRKTQESSTAAISLLPTSLPSAPLPPTSLPSAPLPPTFVLLPPFLTSYTPLSSNPPLNSSNVPFPRPLAPLLPPNASLPSSLAPSSPSPFSFTQTQNPPITNPPITSQNSSGVLLTELCDWLGAGQHELKQVSHWLRGERGVSVEGSTVALPYLPPFICNLKALKTLLQKRAELHKNAVRLLPKTQPTQTEEEELTEAVRQIVREHLGSHPAHQLLKARFLSIFTLPALLASLQPITEQHDSEEPITDQQENEEPITDQQEAEGKGPKESQKKQTTSGRWTATALTQTSETPPPTEDA